MATTTTPTGGTLTSFPGVPVVRAMTTAETADLLGVSVRSFEKLATIHGWGFLIGKHRRFTPAHIEAIINAGEQRSVARTPAASVPTQRSTARSRL